MQLVIVEFLDHCHTYAGATAPLEFKAVGWIVEETAQHIVIAPWTGRKEHGENTDTYTLLKHKGMKIKRLRVKS